MKALTCPVQVSGVAARVDGSLSIRLATPELSADEKAAFMGLMNQPAKMLLQLDEAGLGDVKEVKGQFDVKTPSQRLRSVMFAFWRQADGTGDFEDFYRKRMEDIINGVKAKLEPKP